MNILLITPLIGAIFALALGLFVLSKKANSPLNQTFALFCVETFHWQFCWLISYFLVALTAKDLIVRIAFSVIIFIPFTYYHFAILFLNLSPKKKQVWAAYLFGALFLIVLWTSDLFIAGYRDFWWGYYPRVGPLFSVYLFGVFFYMIRALILIFKALFDEQNAINRNKIKYMALAHFLYFFATVEYAIDYGVPLYPVGAFFIIGAWVVITLAITKHRLLDIEVVIKRTAVYSLMTALLTGLFVSLIYIGEYLFRGLLGFSSLWAGIVGAFIIALIFQPLRDGVETIVDAIFFRARYDYQRILGKYSHTLSQPMADLNRFAHIAPYLLTKSMKLNGCSFMVLDRETHNYVVRAGEKETSQLEGETVAEQSPLIKELKNRKKEISLEEANSIIRFSEDEKEKTKYLAIAEEMKRLKSVLVIPCITESEYFKQPTLLSTINMGKKMSDESFSREDINFLETLANQATISIEYAFIFEELKKNQERVVRAEKLAAVGTTTAGVAHELKNPLTYLSAVAQVLPKKWKDKEFQKTVGQMLPSEVQRMQLIVEGLLDYSRSRELVLNPLDIRTVVDKALALLSYDIKKNKVYPKIDYNHTKKANGDPNRLMQVFMNLLANAVQAMGEKGGDLSIITSDVDGEVRVNIIDTGPGIPQEKLKKIFDPFFTTKEGGTGLGLPISKKIVDEHKGSIYVDSKQGEGTTFTVCLPTA
ncbi:MAG: ATP-binding protein [Candidatus Margulisiibacteriota bacterium]